MLQKIKSFLFENTSDKQTIIKNTFWLMLAEFFSKWWMFLITILIARILWPEQFWILSFVMAFVAMFIVITDFWLTTLMVREVSKDQNKLQEYLVNLSFLKVLLWIITFALVWWVSFFIWKSDIYITLILIYAWYSIVNNFWEFIRAFFRPSEKMQYEALLKIINWIIFLWIVGFSLFYYWDLVSIVYAFLISWIINLIISLLYVVWKFEVGKVRLSKKMINESLRSWLFLMGGMLAVNMFNYIDQIMIWFMRSEEELGFYSAAYRIVSILIMISVIIWNSYLSKINKKQTYIDKKKFVNLLFKYIFSIWLIIAILWIIFSTYIIQILYWNSYIDSVSLLQILIIVAIPMFLNNLYTNWLYSLHLEKKYFIAVLVWLSLNLILNYIFIPKYWAVWASITTIISESICLMFFLYYFYFFKWTIKLDIDKNGK